MSTAILAIEKDTGELLVFESLDDAASYIEPPDVHLYDVFGLDGNGFRVLVDNPPSLWSLRPAAVRLEPTHEFAIEEGRLRSLVIDRLERLGHRPLNPNASVDDLVQLLLELS